jgi:hypothetical protein
MMALQRVAVETDSDFLAHLIELVFAKAAQRAYPISRQFFKWSSLGYTLIRIPFSRIVYIAACLAFVFIHELLLENN